MMRRRRHGLLAALLGRARRRKPRLPVLRCDGCSRALTRGFQAFPAPPSLHGHGIWYTVCLSRHPGEPSPCLRRAWESDAARLDAGPAAHPIDPETLAW
jgi:hypothetical protein